MENHPFYRPSQNPYWSKLKAHPGKVFLDEKSELHQGRWRKQFSDARSTPRKLIVEIGCNGGHVLLERAKQNPEDAFIGIDWKFKQIYRAFEKAEKSGIKNTLFLRAHAIRFDLMFAPEEIDELCFYFPDPWPKRSQLKNRLLTNDWLDRVASRVSLTGRFEIKTDHQDYFHFIEESVLDSLHWEILDRNENIHANHPSPMELEIPEVTLFEKLFIRDGVPIQRLVLGRKKLNPI